MAQTQIANPIGLETDKAERIAHGLNELISEFQVHYQNMLGLHWNVKGHIFFELHEKFEELYNEAKESVDKIAERILTLGYTPFHTLTDYLENSRIREKKGITDDVEAVRTVISDLQQLLEKEREVHEVASDAKDIGTYHLLEDFIASQEKTIWMLNSWLDRKTVNL